MKNRRRDIFEEPGYWQSYSDMMAALLLIFILLIAITLFVYRQKRTDLEQAQLQLNETRQELEASEVELKNSMRELEDAYAKATMTEDELATAYQKIDEAQAELDSTRSELQDIVGIRTDIIGELQKRFDNSSMKVDAQTGTITFSSDVLFRYNSALLTTESKETLQEIIPMYLGVLLQESFRPYISEIIIEGHTDTDGGYQSNMVLSANRANSVAEFCLDPENGLSQEQVDQLQNMLTVNGRSYSVPIYQEGTQEVDMASSRRVEIKFRLKEEEMIERITEILEQE
mgnify:FL=1